MARKGNAVSLTRGNIPVLVLNKVKPPASHNIHMRCSPYVGMQNDFLMLSNNVTRILCLSNSENNSVWNME